MAFLRMASTKLTALQSTAIRQGIVLFALAMAAAIVLPNYWTHSWAWNRLPEIAQIKPLKQIQQQGITLNGWQTLSQKPIEIGGHSWSVQAIVPEAQAATATPQTTALVLLRPQTWIRDLPQVDWMDINGIQQWRTDSVRSIQFTVALPDGQAIPVTARFLRGWTEERTYAVVQWYVWSTGGSPSPTDWFWANQIARWRRQPPQPWIAVSVMQPIDPLGNIETVHQSLAVLAQQIQTQLIETALKSSS
ncbi:cyanoexosortase B system-associated protein [Leptolyngbya ohadii]|uniref:cyanoexosortase B system-associated protein n=1 Tax=Leptolyngbya ohadii TaxID=1962290 RepID=UPI000B5A13BF|nr:cyanoexosortase B system-associated protein [Leptolyngbya ohadii]